LDKREIAAALREVKEAEEQSTAQEEEGVVQEEEEEAGENTEAGWDEDEDDSDVQKLGTRVRLKDHPQFIGTILGTKPGKFWIEFDLRSRNLALQQSEELECKWYSKAEFELLSRCPKNRASR
jgi:hypothetical protein